ncbi:MAG: hypothetical protein JWP87_4076 [Labilithrix sp.]|nr:hypothetical protein [Labilithrix sp.]
MPPSCPWTWLEPATSRFCEDAVCGYVREPANTWSNVGFVACGLWMLRCAPTAPRLVRRFAWVALFLGVGSAAFHATRTYLGGLLDTAGMQATAAFLIAANMRRLFPARSDMRTFWSLAAIGTLAAIAFEAHERTIYGVEMATAGLLELAILRRSGPWRAHRWLAWSWATFIPGYALWWVDVNRVVCSPAAHVVNGHAAWHLLMAASLFAMYRWHLTPLQPRTELHPPARLHLRRQRVSDGPIASPRRARRPPGRRAR